MTSCLPAQVAEKLLNERRAHLKSEQRLRHTAGKLQSVEQQLAALRTKLAGEGPDSKDLLREADVETLHAQVRREPLCARVHCTPTFARAFL
jgi:hypothetical protein